MTEKLYEQIASQLRGQIARGVYPPGERLPGIRKLKTGLGVSISTVLSALALLEAEGLIEAQSRSGFYVKPVTLAHITLPTASQPDLIPQPVTSQQLALNLVKASHHVDILQLSTAVPDECFLPTDAIGRSVAHVSRRQKEHSSYYEFPPGHIELRRQIAKRLVMAGCEARPDDVVITAGCQEAIILALQAVGAPGDVVAVESPTFYGLLQAINYLGMKALEIPTDPVEGLNLGALEMALEQWQIKACVAVSNFSNPLGYCMSDGRKAALVDLLERYQVPLIEDDIYGDLGFSGDRPVAFKAFDTQDQVLYCSSFSKTVAPGLRVGWVFSHQYREKIEFLKYVNNLSAPTLSQRALAHYLQHANHDRFLRRVRSQYQRQVHRMLDLITHYFPTGTRVSQPKGGFVIWVELPIQVNALELYRLALEARISIAPGQIFSARQKYEHFIRLNSAVQWSTRVEAALKQLGQLASTLAVS